jgi:hypothetical protein
MHNGVQGVDPRLQMRAALGIYAFIQEAVCMTGGRRAAELFVCIFFGRVRVCWPLLCFLYVAHFIFLRDVRIRTHKELP